MNQALENNLFDYVNYPTVKCPAIAKQSTQQAISPEGPLQLHSIQEPQYSVLAWEPFWPFLLSLYHCFLVC